ncbi:MAG: type II CRISPR RNA-guided endonuclease Cas9 [Burkholderiaceae bacterium]|jgi:CRISPR-associated endonuclease Csn1|nr:type II CRISPR RNA-guided endonuclease Cas9 [Burkholderiaceae bacterium]
MNYRLALDLGSTSLGWALFRLNADKEPAALIKAGVRIFSDGRNPKDGSSLAVTRRAARMMRRRRDRLLKRKSRMMRTLIAYGFFPADEAARKALEQLDPYALRAKGLNEAITPGEFARALFHINQRRGFKSNRKTDKKDNDSSALKAAIQQLHAAIDPQGREGKPRTVGEWLHQRNKQQQTMRARFRQERVPGEEGKIRIEKSYDLYIDRAAIEAEFDALWSKQAELNPAQFNETAREELKDCLLHQRPLKPVVPGRCTLIPEEPRAPLALPSQQRFRIYQEVNNLRILGDRLQEQSLSLDQRNKLVAELDCQSKLSFTQIRKLLRLPGTTQFNLEDAKRQEIKGNITGAILSKKDLFGPAWGRFDEARQDAIVMQLLTEENEACLVRWQQEQTGVDEARAEALANVSLPEGYGSLSAKALARILPELRREVVTYDKAVQAAGFEHHSNISHAATGEILPELPYYGEYLQRHVGFGSGNPSDPPEKRFGKIANPTVHIGLNQVRVVVNVLIKRYGHPSEVIVEVARELKQNKEQREKAQQTQASNQKRNERLRQEAAAVLQCSPELVRRSDIEKLILWEELSPNVANRCCPYSGVQIGKEMLLSDRVEIEHILPFAQTLDDTLNNKTVAMREANRIKGNRPPWEAHADFEAQGWDYESILSRAQQMPAKYYRFCEDGLQKWLREDKSFLARALNDTKYLSRVAREYLSLICPQGTRVIPGRMTAMLRRKFGLDGNAKKCIPGVLRLIGEKNRNDHRHHAVDACVIGVTDQGMLQKFAQASSSAREKQLDRLVETMPLPWLTYPEHVRRAINAIWVSHKPDHGYEGAMMEETSYGIRRDGSIKQRRKADGSTGREISNLIRIAEPGQLQRHGVDAEGRPLPYKGYVGGSNYCIEITVNDRGKWEGQVISTFEAYLIAQQDGLHQLRHPTLGQNGKPLVMRLMINDSVRLEVDGMLKIMRVRSISPSGQVFMAPIHEANVDARNRDKTDTFAYTSKIAGSFQKARGRRVTISPIGELRDPGFKE